MKGSNSKLFASAALSWLLSVSSWVQAESDCRFSPSKNGNPEGFTKTLNVKLDSGRQEFSTRTRVAGILESEVRESGIIESASWGFQRVRLSATWGCNFSMFRWLDGNERVLTAKHCVSDRFDGVNADAWSSMSFASASARMSIAKKPETVLEVSLPAEEGDEVAMSGCVPSGEGCYRVEGVVRNLFEKEGETVKGVWLTASEYLKMVGGNPEASLDGYSGTPVLDVNGKVSWVVSATLRTDFKEDERGKCLPTVFGLAIAPILHE